ncbi:MAG: hypothetical protein AAGA10_13325 [Bacteroidota bacterium]
MKVEACIIVFCITWGYSIWTLAQDFLKSPVVLIRSTDSDGLEETGTGFFVGKDDNSLYILTAKHVLLDNSPTLQFFNGP